MSELLRRNKLMTLCYLLLTFRLSLFYEVYDVKFNQESIQLILSNNEGSRLVADLLQCLNNMRLISEERKDNSCCMD